MPTGVEIQTALAERGYRNTLSRRLIADAVAEKSTAFTGQELADELAPHGVGRATVFRALNVLHELGLLNRLHLGDACDRYTTCDPQHHHHLVCTSCGTVFPLEGCTITEDVQQTANNLGFQVKGHVMEIFGRCAECVSD